MATTKRAARSRPASRRSRPGRPARCRSSPAGQAAEAGRLRRTDTGGRLREEVTRRPERRVPACRQDAGPGRSRLSYQKGYALGTKGEAVPAQGCAAVDQGRAASGRGKAKLGSPAHRRRLRRHPRSERSGDVKSLRQENAGKGCSLTPKQAKKRSDGPEATHTLGPEAGNIDLNDRQASKRSPPTKGQSYEGRGQLPTRGAASTISASRSAPSSTTPRRSPTTSSDAEPGRDPGAARRRAA